MCVQDCFAFRDFSVSDLGKFGIGYGNITAPDTHCTENIIVAVVQELQTYV
jgi:hypothetical protein